LFASGSRFDQTGAVEVEIGVRAERRRLRRLIAGVAGVALTVVAFAFAWMLTPARGQPAGQQHPVRVACSRCGLEETRQVKARDSFPLVCTRCAERAADEIWRCRDCGRTFPADRTARGEQACPSCGSVRVGSAVAAAKTGSFSDGR